MTGRLNRNMDRKYGAVPFDYGSFESSKSRKNVWFDRTMLEKKNKAGPSVSEVDDENEDGPDNDTCEEWERHEALHNDVQPNRAHGYGGFGGKIMAKSGWKPGEGLGKKNQGISTPIEEKGQKPSNKFGLGYCGDPVPVRYDRSVRFCKGGVIGGIVRIEQPAKNVVEVDLVDDSDDSDDDLGKYSDGGSIHIENCDMDAEDIIDDVETRPNVTDSKDLIKEIVRGDLESVRSIRLPNRPSHSAALAAIAADDESDDDIVILDESDDDIVILDESDDDIVILDG